MKSPTETIQQQIESERLLETMLQRMNARVLGLTLGALCATGLFVATNLLLIKGGPNPGQNLRLLGQFFIGYDVTFVGSVIGAVWAFAAGFLAGLVISKVYNLVAGLRRS